MFIRSHSALRSAVLLLGALSFAACQSPKAEQERAAALNSKIQEMQALAAAKDSLLQEVAANARLMQDIDSALTKVRERKKAVPEGAQLQTTLSDREFIKEKIQEVVTRLNESETRLAATQKRVKALSGQTDSLKSNLADFQTLIEDQRNTITSLSDQVNSLQEENVQLTQDKTALTDTVHALADTVHTLTIDKNTVYYVVGTKQELLEKGLVVEEGSKFLFFGKKVLQPARELDPAQFTTADRRQLTEIPFPLADKRYRVVSRQNLAFLVEKPDESGRLAGQLQIGSPEGFWAPSKFLIIVQS